jgi:hypothetical protein
MMMMMIIIISSPFYNIFAFSVNCCYFLPLSIPIPFFNFPGTSKCAFTAWREYSAAQDAHVSDAESLRPLSKHCLLSLCENLNNDLILLSSSCLALSLGVEDE